MHPCRRHIVRAAWHGRRPALLTAQSFAIDVPLLSLLSRQFAVKRLLLVQPTIELRIDAEGRRNWSFAAGRLAALSRPPPPTPGSGSQRRNPSLAPRRDRVSRPPSTSSALENVHISDGTLRFSDERNGALK